MKRFYIFSSLILILFIIFFNCQQASESGGGSSSGGSNSKDSDDTTGETSFKKTIDSTGDVGAYTSMAVEGSNVYISYYDGTYGDLKFSKSTDGGNTWDTGNIKTIDSTGVVVGWDTSIAVDGSNIYISYYDSTNQNLKFSKSTDGGANWDPGNIKTIDSTVSVGRYTSIAVDGLNVYVSYYDSTNGDLKFAKSTDRGANWNALDIQKVDSTDNIGAYTSIAVDGLNVCISYYDATNGDLKFAKSTDGGANWDPGNIKTIDSTVSVGRYTSIAVDGLNVYVSYYDSTNDDLKFTKSTDGGANWDPGNIKIVDYTGNVGEYTSIAVDGLNVCISYYDATNGDLKFAKSTDRGANWNSSNIHTVDSTDNVGWYTSIAVDSSDVYITYYDSTNQNLKFAKSVDNGNTW